MEMEKFYSEELSVLEGEREHTCGVCAVSFGYNINDPPETCYCGAATGLYKSIVAFCIEDDCDFPQYNEGPRCMRHAIDHLCENRDDADDLIADASEAEAMDLYDRYEN